MLKIGLSWPSLTKVLGRPVAIRQRWAVLYLGSAKVADARRRPRIVVLNRKGELENPSDALLRDIEGIVLLDGTWSQAKALWWRNAWMLKCRRVILDPRGRRATASCAASRAATASPPSRPPRC